MSTKKLALKKAQARDSAKGQASTPDPLAELIKNKDQAMKRSPTTKADADQSLKRRKTIRIRGQKTIRTVQKQHVSIMAVALRQFFIKKLKEYLSKGEIRSKYFAKFEIIDVISPKSYVIKPKSRSVQSECANHKKFLFKQLDYNSVQMFCGTANPTAFQVNQIIDPWIKLAPKTPHIVTAYEVYKDYDQFMQMTEYCDGFDNVYTRLKKAKFGLLQESIPRPLIRMVYLFVIQISHAFAYAHSCNLTHGIFDLTQALVNTACTVFKITNFRPWRAFGKEYDMTKECQSASLRTLSTEQRQRVAKSNDLYAFGEALYDLMLNKSNRADLIQQKVVMNMLSGDKESGEQNLAKTASLGLKQQKPPTSPPSQTGSAFGTQESSLKYLSAMDNKFDGGPALQDDNIMPVMETIPLAWVQIQEGACIIDILHQCMLIDTQRDTVKLFNRINKQATEQYQKFFDSSFKPLPLPDQITDEYMHYFKVAGLNNRAVMTQFKIMSHQLGKQVSELDNQVVLDFQEHLFAECLKIDPTCEESIFNQIILLWRRGKLFDDEICTKIVDLIEDRQTALLLILLFRKANHYPVDQAWEARLLKATEPTEALGSYIYKALTAEAVQASLKNAVSSSGAPNFFRPTGPQAIAPTAPLGKENLKCMQVHVSQCIPPPLALQVAKQSSGVSASPKPQLNKDGQETNQLEVKRICFSKNEKYMVLVTRTQAVVLKIIPSKFEVIGQVDLPTVLDYSDCDDQTLRQLNKEADQAVANIEMLKTSQRMPPYQDQTNGKSQLFSGRAAVTADGVKVGADRKSAESVATINDSEYAARSQHSSLERGGSMTMSERTSALEDEHQVSTTDDGTQAFNSPQRMRLNKRLRSSEMEGDEYDQARAEERRKQRDRECTGGGFKNTDWLAVIDNQGETLCLHSSQSVQLIPKLSPSDYAYDSLDAKEHEVAASSADPDRRMRVISELHVYTGPRFMQKTKLQIGHICPDEILHLEMDNLPQSDNEDGVNNPVTCYSSMESLIKVDVADLKQSPSKPKDKRDFKQHPNLNAGGPQNLNKGRNMGRMGAAPEGPQVESQTQIQPSLPSLPSTFIQEPSSDPMSKGQTKTLENTPDKGALLRPTNMISFANQGVLGDEEIQSEELSIGEVSGEGSPSPIKQVKGRGHLTGEAAIINTSSLADIDGMQVGSVMLSQAAGQQDVSGSGAFNSYSKRLDGYNDEAAGRLRAARYGLNRQISVVCKNTLVYELAFATDRTQLADQVPMVLLASEPTRNPGGASIPVSLFRDPVDTKGRSTIKVFDYLADKFWATEEGPVTEKAETRLSFKTAHYEHMREWVQRQEMLGNTIKFGLIDSKYCVGFQRSTYKGMKPHFFVYEILKRKVVRRFFPLMDPFKPEWSDAEGGAVFADASAGLKSNDDSDNEDNTSGQTGLEDFAEDVSVFEVSPKGTFVVALVSQEFLALKMLPRSTHQAFRRLLTPSFMIQEHIEVRTDDDVFELSLSRTSSAQESNKHFKKIKYEQDRDQNVFAVSAQDESFTSSQPDKVAIAEKLAQAYTDYEDFVGSSYYKHVRLYKYYTTLVMALKDTNALIYPPDGSVPKNGLVAGGQTFSQTSQAFTVSAMDSDTDVKGDAGANKQISAKTLRKVLIAIKEYNFSYSVPTPQTQMLSGNIVTSNLYSRKVGVVSLKKLCVFDQIVFGRPDDKIKQFLFSSFPRNWRVAVFFRRTLQIYDQITGQQTFELVCPSAKKIAFIDNENLLVVQEGSSQVFICAVNSQKQAFLNREQQVKRGDALQTQEYEENQKFNQYTIGISVQRQENQNKGNYTDGSEASNSDDETVGIKVIVFDETIKQMVTSRNVSPFGYLALIGETKTAIYLTYAEEDSCTYDHVWTINNWDLRKLGIGKRIELIDFSPNCEEFLAYSNTGELSLWSIKKMKFIRKVATFKKGKMMPITDLRSFHNNQSCVAFSQPNNLLFLININPNYSDNLIKQIRPESEGFGRLLSFQIDHSESFLICTFSNDKVGFYQTTDGKLALLADDNGALQCHGSFIDETGCFISMLDETRTKVNIYVIEWKYEVEMPPQRVRRVSTLGSLDAYSDKQGRTSGLSVGTLDLPLANANKSVAMPKKTSKNGKFMDLDESINHLSKSTVYQVKKLTLKERKAKLRKELEERDKKEAQDQDQKSKLCTVF